MSATFHFKHKGFDVTATVTHTGTGVSVTADLIHPDMPSPEALFSLISAAIANKGK